MKTQLAVLPWVGGVVVLLAVGDAAQVAMARVFMDAYNRFMQKLPLNGGNAMKADEFVLPAPVLGWRQAGQVLAATGSFSVWPFYGALLALVVGFHVQSSQPEKTSARLLPSSAANFAKPSSGSAKAAVPINVGSPASNRPSQPANPLSTGNPPLPAPLQPRNGIPQFPNRPTQFQNPAVRPVTGTPQPRQSPPYSPIPASPVQPGVTTVPSVPTVPGAPAGIPQNASPAQTQPTGVAPAPQTPAAGQSPASPATNPNTPSSPDAPR